MIRPIIAYGDPILRQKSARVPADYPDLKNLIADMFETMYHASGVGLAAPQIGKPMRLFIVDLTPFATDEANAHMKGFKRIFINAEKIEESGEGWQFNEGCLSLPTIREDVVRPASITLAYDDGDFNRKRETFDGLIARVLQHEYDHTEGILFTDKLSPLKKRLLKGKLNDIARGSVDVNYPMRFPLGGKAR
ncbi:MAG: peptide deformylase [Flavobacteriales bacterium]